MLNKVFGALTANVGTSSTDGGLSRIAVCPLHGCHGSSLYIVVLLLTGFTAGVFCGAELRFASGLRRRFGMEDDPSAPAEAVSVSVGHGQVGRSGVRLG